MQPTEKRMSIHLPNSTM